MCALSRNDKVVHVANNATALAFLYGFFSGSVCGEVEIDELCRNG